MGWDLFFEMVKIFGLPLTMAFVAVIWLAKGWVIPKGTHDAIVKDRDDQIRKLERREARILEVALSSTKGLEQATTTLKVEREQHELVGSDDRSDTRLRRPARRPGPPTV